MTKMATDMVLSAPRRHVWAVLADLEGVSHWNPTIERAECITEQRTGLGAQRRCYMSPSGWMVESIAEWEPTEVIAFQVENAPPLKSGYGRFVLSDAPGGTRLRGSFDYEVRFGPLGPVIDRLVVQRQLNAGWTAGMEGLKHHVEELTRPPAMPGNDPRPSGNAARAGAPVLPCRPSDR